jgi:subtilase family serine protease
MRIQSSFSRSCFFLTLALIFVFTGMGVSHADSGSRTARPLITQKIDDTKLVTLEGNTPPVAKSSRHDRGAVAEDFPMNHMLLLLKRSPEQEKALGTLMDQLHTPGNANYHKWLSEAEWDQSFGVNQGDVAQVVGWLESHGFKVSGVTPDGLMIDFSGTAGMIREAFHTEIHNVVLSNGDKHIANISDPRIPAALADVVAGPTALHNFMPHPTNVKRNPVSLTGGEAHVGEKGPHGEYTFSNTNGTFYAFVPGDAQVIYNVKPLLTGGYTGKGSTIGLVEDSNAYNETGGVAPDWTTFMSAFGLTSYGGKQTTVHPTGSLTCTDPGDTNDGTDFEVELDIEYASAMAPGATSAIESCADTSTTFGGLIAVENLASQTTVTAPVLSISYGYCEAANGAANNAAFSSAYQKAQAKGISVFVSSGDESSRSCDADEAYAVWGLNVSGFTSTPYNVSVGGTDFGDSYNNDNSTYWNASNSSTYASAKSYIPEIPWNDACASELISTTEGYSTTYGASGFCNSEFGQEYFITTASGSGGASNCYSGTPSVTGTYGGSYGAVGTSGTCKGQPKPSWQSVYGNPADGVRDIPDVSLFAANGVWGHYIVICYSNLSQQGGATCTGAPSGWTGVGGTSASSPMMAGIQTLVNQYAGSMSGNPNYTYYQLAGKEYGSSGSTACNSSNGTSGTSGCNFYDITQGDINVPCYYLTGTTAYNCYGVASDTYGVGSLTNSSYSKAYGTTKGWDFATGIGSVNAYNLAVAFKGGSTSPATTTTKVTVTPGDSFTVGTKATLKATVTASAGTATGTITFSVGGTAIGTCTLSSGSCSLSESTTGLAAGTYPLAASYPGATGYDASTSSTVNVTLEKATSTTTLTVGTNPITPPAKDTLTATVTTAGGAPTGKVTFSVGSVVIGSANVSGGKATLTASSAGLMAGTYPVTAAYSGNTYADASTSSAVNVVVK